MQIEIGCKPWNSALIGTWMCNISTNEHASLLGQQFHCQAIAKFVVRAIQFSIHFEHDVGNGAQILSFSDSFTFDALSQNSIIDFGHFLYFTIHLTIFRDNDKQYCDFRSVADLFKFFGNSTLQFTVWN